MYVPVLLSAAIVVLLGLNWVCCRWRFDLLRQQTHENKNRLTRHQQHTQISSNSSTIAADNSTATYTIRYSTEFIAFPKEYTLFINCNFNLVYRYFLSVNLYLSLTV